MAPLEPSRDEPQHTGASSSFLAMIEDEAALPPFLHAADAARSATRALLERLTPGQAHIVVASLPPDVREIVGGEDVPMGRSPTHGGRAQLFDRVGGELGVAPASAELVVAAVFEALHQVLPADVVSHVGQQLPHDLRHLWLRPEVDASEDVTGDLDLLRQVLDDIERSGALPPRLDARDAFSSVMCLFEQRLSGGEARALCLGLPRALRPFVERCMLERREEPTTFELDELFANVSVDLGVDLAQAEAIVAAVLAAVSRALPEEEVTRAASQLPTDLRRMWLA